MRKLLIFIFSIYSISTFSQTKSNNLFSINIGNFANPELVDFSALQKYGLVYAASFGNDQAQIFVGDFAEKSNAESALVNIKNAFPEAYVAQKKGTTGSIPTIQVGSKKVGEKINWKAYENAGNIFAACDGKITRILSAGFANDSIAKIALEDLKDLGYKDAILKNYSEINLHKVSKFESGLTLDAPIKKQEKKVAPPPVKIPETTVKAIDIYTGNYPNAELKRALSALGTYKGKIDDKADATLSKSFEEAKTKDKVLAKYVILAQSYKPEIQKVTELQQAINNIVKEPEVSAKTLTKSSQPIAKAYRAYLLFTQNGDAKTINSLMNEAIQAAFKGVKNNKFPFDPSSTYDYKDLSQVIKHIRYIQGVAKDEPAAPSWLFTEHTKDAKSSFTGDYKIEATDPALNLEVVKMTKLLADDMVANWKKDAIQDQKNLQERSKLMLNPTLVVENQDTWNKQLWEGLDNWAAKDALNQQSVNAFKAAFYESVVTLQQYFTKEMGMNNSPLTDISSRNMALAVMKSIVERPLAQYGRQKK